MKKERKGKKIWKFKCEWDIEITDPIFGRRSRLKYEPNNRFDILT